MHCPESHAGQPHHGPGRVPWVIMMTMCPGLPVSQGHFEVLVPPYLTAHRSGLPKIVFISTTRPSGRDD